MNLSICTDRSSGFCGTRRDESDVDMGKRDPSGSSAFLGNSE